MSSAHSSSAEHDNGTEHDTRIELRSARSRVALAPALGGVIASYEYEGRQVLRSAPPAMRDPREAACFPLVPFVNRIANGRFVFDGRHVLLPPNIAGEKHPLHGDGWVRAWHVEEQTPESARLALDHAADAWPWAYTATQSFELGEDTLRVTLSAVNRDTRPMPVGLGFHPYFPNDGRTRLRAHVDDVLLTDDEHLPLAYAPAARIADFREGVPVERDSLIDHSFTGWRRSASVDIPASALGVRLTASPALGVLHVYSPPGQGYCCIEPVSHLPDALNQHGPGAAGLQILEPGETFEVSMTLAIVSLD